MNTILFPVDFIENQINQIAPPDLKRICRICMGCSPVMSNIFMEYEGQPINEFIMECFPVRIQPGEKLPELICSPCLEKLVVVRQFRLLCLHSDRVLRNELSNIMEQNSSISVLPVQNIQHHLTPATGETFIDPSGNQVILVANTANNKENSNVEEETPTYYILQDGSAQQNFRTVTAEPQAPAPPQQKDEDLILIEDEDEDDGHASDKGDAEADAEEDEATDGQNTNSTEKAAKRTSTSEDEPLANRMKKARKNSPEFQFVDINATGTENDENLIEILEDETSVDVKVCDKCASPYETSMLEHNLICAANFRECQFCGLGELNVLEFDQHIRQMHIKEYRVCPNCRHVFLEEKHFLHHHCKHLIVVDFNVNMYTCAFCLQTFDNLKAFTHHYYKEHHKKSNCVCNKYA